MNKQSFSKQAIKMMLNIKLITLMHGDIAAVAIAVDEGIFVPAALVGANAAAPDHFAVVSGTPGRRPGRNAPPSPGGWP